MASVFITNALQVNFESVLGISDNVGMVNMFKALESLGYEGFWDVRQYCMSRNWSSSLTQHLCKIMTLPVLSPGMPNNLVLQARTVFSKYEKPVQYSCKKRLLKYEFRLLNDILDKSITVKAGSFDAVTHERFFMMTAIHFGVKLETDLAEPAVARSEDITVEISKHSTAVTDEESMSIEDLLQQIPSDSLLPFVLAAEPTRIKFSNGISIPGVADGYLYKANISVKEEKVFTWAETDSVQIALQRRLYIVAKYRELLLRNFLEAYRANFSFGQPWSAMALQIIYLLSIAHNTAVKELLLQKQAHVLQWTRPCCSMLFEGVFDHSFYIPINHKTILSTCWIQLLRFIGGSWMVEDGYDRWVYDCETPVSQLWEKFPEQIALHTLAPICLFFEPVQRLSTFSPPAVKYWVVMPVGPVVGDVSIPRRVVDFVSYRIQIIDSFLPEPSPVSSFNICTVVMPVGPVVGDVSIPRRVVDFVSYRIQIIDSFLPEPSVQATPVVDIASVPTDFASLSPTNSDLSLPSPHQSPSTDSSMHFDTADIPLGTDTAVEQILLPTTAAPLTTNLSEQFAQLRASISQLSIKKLKTQRSIGNVQNHLLSRINDLEKAYANARTQQEQDLRGHFKSVRQEVQIQKTALSFEVHEFKQGVRAQSGIFSTDLATIRNEVRDVSKEFDDRLAVIRNDLLEFLVETQGKLASLAFVTKGRNDKKGEVGSSHVRSQPPPPPPGDGGNSGSRGEPSRKIGRSGSTQKSWRYWLNE
ncbi:replication protein A 70 kDa DNA-binding subunit B-like [Dorcoceras hygrometricum]|uniref:Replication protein A 70 kDa DNA-binding subunit B-like n=1 Tax=Dorcoceras hygrometricum TaxID=472368 RepID=A0A2Z7CFK0_9LAMI|nr:replication protein A 70 kDa DNA-binding subunit B-like [Dorcoceras hygrometricum]